MLTRKHLRIAMGASPWDLSNQVLYDLCREHPGHSDAHAIIAKLLLIGRTYAAAIERRQGVDELKGDRFYVEVVRPQVQQSAIDDWLADARGAVPGTSAGIETLLNVHFRTTKLFKKISGRDKRSLASKYLHFHVPQLFYIYDARAMSALRQLNGEVPRRHDCNTLGDREYRKFVERCEDLRRYCLEEFQVNLKPRQLDNLLLAVHDQKGDRESQHQSRK